jgi:hypothetical protein
VHTGKYKESVSDLVYDRSRWFTFLFRSQNFKLFILSLRLPVLLLSGRVHVFEVTRHLFFVIAFSVVH